MSFSSEEFHSDSTSIMAILAYSRNSYDFKQILHHNRSTVKVEPPFDILPSQIHISNRDNMSNRIQIPL